MINKLEAASNALAFLNNIPTGVLGTVSTALEPHTSTIYFTPTNDFSIYFIVSHHSEKFRNLTANPRASFTAGTGPIYREVMIRGTVELISDTQVRESTIALIAKRVASPMQEWPLFKINALESGGTAVFKLTPTNVQYLDLESVSDADDYVKYIYQLVP